MSDRLKITLMLAPALARESARPYFVYSSFYPANRPYTRAFEDVEDCAKVVSFDEIKKEGWTLNISRYVLPPIGADIPPLPEAVEAFKTALAEARAAEDHLRTVLTEGGWLN